VARGHLAVMLLIGLMLALYQLCYFGAIPLVGVAVATLVTLCTAPVLVALLSAGLLRERLSGRLLLALGCALAGTGLLVDLSSAGGARPDLAANGVLLALGSALGYAVVTMCSRFLAPKYHPLQPVTIGFGVGAIVLLPVAGVAGLGLSYPAAGWLLLVYLGVVPSALAYALFIQGMRQTTATAASIVTLLEPLTAAGLAWLLFGERLGPLGLAGAALLLAAVALLSTGQERRGA
jgi:drug/metabolite transporter, DME family